MRSIWVVNLVRILIVDTDLMIQVNFTQKKISILDLDHMDSGDPVHHVRFEQTG